MQPIDNPTEILDLVDEHDRQIGTIARWEVTSLEERKRGFVRAVGVFVVNARGQLWIPRRSMTKKIAPGGLDFSAGEHLGRGETYEYAALRGLIEELKIHAEADQLNFLGIISPFPGMPYFHHIFLHYSDVAPNFDREDYIGFEWIMPEALLKKLDCHEPAKEILLPAAKLLMIR
jgi:isopentenyldiphosphate isomerase